MRLFICIIYSSPWQAYSKQDDRGPRIFAHAVLSCWDILSPSLSMLLHSNPAYHFLCFDLLG